MSRKPRKTASRAVAPAALRHRLILNFEGQAESVAPDDIIIDALESGGLLYGAEPQPGVCLMLQVVFPIRSLMVLFQTLTSRRGNK